MLSQETIVVIKSTAPILAEHGETLTRHFYKRMFEHNPEVIPLFNTSNQEAGSQQKALAGAICAYAANIDNLGALAGAVELIAQKHASLQIKPEHYPIVGQNLLASIKEVLGDGATDEVINAWAQAYGFLAEVLIGREKQIYQHNLNQTGGWEGHKPLKVISKIKESENITSFYLSKSNGETLPLFTPGQYITVKVPNTDGRTTMRNYSLSDQPGKDWFRISVKKEDQGYVSQYLHNNVQVNDEIEVAPPCGEFTLKNEKMPLVLLAGGVGITPIMSMLEANADTDRQITLIYATMNEKVQAFKKRIDELSKNNSNLKVHYCYTSPIDQNIGNEKNSHIGIVDKELLNKIITDRESSKYYFCGPKNFMLSIKENLESWNVPTDYINYEFFGPKQ